MGLKKSRATPRHFEDLELRAEYRRKNVYCELAGSGLFMRFSPGTIILPDSSVVPMSAGASEVHHLTGGILGTSRYDLWENLIHLSRPIHTFCERYTHDGIALCCAAKIAKEVIRLGGGPGMRCEFSVGVFSRIMRVNFSGWFEGITCRTDVGEAAKRSVLGWMAQAAA